MPIISWLTCTISIMIMMNTGRVSTKLGSARPGFVAMQFQKAAQAKLRPAGPHQHPGRQTDTGSRAAKAKMAADSAGHDLIVPEASLRKRAWVVCVEPWDYPHGFSAHLPPG